MSVIPGVQTYHPRSEWESGEWYGDLFRDSSFHRKPPPLDLGNVDRNAIHYTSAINLPDGDPGEILTGIDGIRQLLLRSTYDYLTNRTNGGYRRLSDDRWFPGYPLGYSFAFDWLGGVWEINGFDYLPAATGGHNGHTLAYLMLTDRADPAPELMWQSMRAVAREAKRRGSTRMANDPWAHGWFAERTGVGTSTDCCGNALKEQIEQGLGNLDYEENTMHTVNERAYDSRGNQQDWAPALRQANQNVSLGEFLPGEKRKIFVGMTNRAEVHLTVIGTKPGYITISGVDSKPKTSMVNVQSASGVDSGTWTLGVPEGAIYIWSSSGEVDVVVDVIERQ